MSREEFISRCHKRLNCPICRKELIRLEPFIKGRYEFWCDDCKIDIEIDDNYTMDVEEE